MKTDKEYNFRCSFASMLKQYEDNKLTYAEFEQWVVDNLKNHSQKG